ncbi:hypothetical protein PDK93_25375 [Bacillus cereus]|nr:hypothetical protein [Bacillus cereus]
MGYKIEYIRNITQGKRKGYKEISIETDDNKLMNFHMLFDTDNECVHCFCFERSYESTKKEKQNIDRFLKSGEYRLQELFCEKREDTFLRLFDYVEKREELKEKEKIIFFRRDHIYGDEYNYRLYEDRYETKEVTGCFPDFYTLQGHLIQTYDLPNKLRKMGFILYDIDDKSLFN